MRRSLTGVGITMAILFALVVAGQTVPVTVVDDRGVEIRIDARPERIVAIGALYVQVVVALGATDRLVGVASSPDNPEAVAGVPDVGPSYAPNVEAVIDLAPDLVLGATDWGGERETLEAAGLTVLTTPTLTSVTDVLRSIRSVGEAIGEAHEAALLVGGVAQEILAAEEKVLGRTPVRAAFLYATADAAPYGVGDGTIEDELILRAGGENVFHDVQGFPQVSIESVVARDPKVIFTAPTQIEAIIGNPLLRTVAAVKDGRVHGVNASHATSTRVAEVLGALIAALHGE